MLIEHERSPIPNFYVESPWDMVWPRALADRSLWEDELEKPIHLCRLGFASREAALQGDTAVAGSSRDHVATTTHIADADNHKPPIAPALGKRPRGTTGITRDPAPSTPLAPWTSNEGDLSEMATGVYIKNRRGPHDL